MSDTSKQTIPESANFNATDVGFAQGMIPHHAQAVEMADLALEKSTNADVLALAKQIKASQNPEIQTMSGWLQSWGQKVPSTDSMSGGGHDMTDMGESTGTSRASISSRKRRPEISIGRRTT